MPIEVDRDSPVYSYLQLAAGLRQQIKRGEIVAKLPSVPALMEQTGLSKTTVRHATRVLVEENLIQTVPGRGTFVNRQEGRPKAIRTT
jgi:DNA-binding GntR family transcriptional regulator